MYSSFRYFSYAALILFSLSCGGYQYDDYTIESENGVTYVTNHRAPSAENFTVGLKFVNKIGDLDTKDENLQFFKPVGVAVDNEQNLYVLDSGNHRVQVFDTDRKFKKTIGRRGQGPGEFEQCKEISIINDKLFVGQHRVISELTFDGKETGRIPVEFPYYDLFKILPSGDILTTFSKGRKTEHMEDLDVLRALSVYSNEGELVRDFGEWMDYGHWYKNFEGNTVSVCTAINGSIYAAYNEQNRVSKYSPQGDLLLEIARPLNYELNYEMVTHENGRELMRPMPIFVKTSKGIFVDSKERIWVLSYKKQFEDEAKANEYLHFEVFNFEGILLGYVEAPYAHKVQMFNDHVYFIDTKQEMSVFEYQIVEN